MKIVIKSLDTFVSRDGYREIHHVSVDAFNSGGVGVELDFNSAMEGKAVTIVDQWAGTYKNDQLMRNDGSDGKLDHVYEVGPFTVEVSPDYVKERVASLEQDLI